MLDVGFVGDAMLASMVSSRAMDATEPARECAPFRALLTGFFAEADSEASCRGRLGDGPGRL